MVAPVYILDLDGTLLPSHFVDNECYWQAVGEVFRRDLGTLALGEFTNVTDGAILREWCRKSLGRPATAAEIARVRARFLELLQAAASERPECFRAMPGAGRWLARLREAGGVAAIATGGWRHSAEFKLRCARLDRLALPLASADDGARRTTIMRNALERLGSVGRARGVRPTHIGDTPWDARSAMQLGWRFIGIARGDRALALQRLKAGPVYRDFLDLLADTGSAVY